MGLFLLMESAVLHLKKAAFVLVLAFTLSLICTCGCSKDKDSPILPRGGSVLPSEPEKVTCVEPLDGATQVAITTWLWWNHAPGINTYDVYLGTNYTAVEI